MWNNCDTYSQTWLWLQKMLPWIPLSILAKNPQGSPHESPHLLQVKEWFLEEPFKFQTSSGFLQIRPPILHHYHVLHDATVSDLQVKSTVFHSKWVICFWVPRKKHCFLSGFRIVAVFFKRLLPAKQKIVGEKLRILMRGPWNLLLLKFQDHLTIFIRMMKMATTKMKKKCWMQLTRHVLLLKQKERGSWVRGMDHFNRCFVFYYRLKVHRKLSRHNIDKQINHQSQQMIEVRMQETIARILYPTLYEKLLRKKCPFDMSTRTICHLTFFFSNSQKLVDISASWNCSFLSL